MYGHCQATTLMNDNWTRFSYRTRKSAYWDNLSWAIHRMLVSGAKWNLPTFVVTIWPCRTRMLPYQRDGALATPPSN